MNYSLRLIKLKQVLRYAHQQDSRKYKSCLEDSTIRNPVHTRETRMCGGYSANPNFCLEGSTPPIRYSLPGWLVDGRSISEGILSFVEYAPRLRMVLPSRQLLTTRLAKILKSMLKNLAENIGRHILPCFARASLRTSKRSAAEGTCTAWWALANKAKSW